MMTHIFLIGFMGAGKSRLGHLLAARLGCPFIDLDHRLEAAEGRSIREIFASAGEAGFRAAERDCLHSLQHEMPAVVATGGGTPCFFDNIYWMNAQGRTIYLRVSPAVLSARLLHEREQRPLLRGIEAADLPAFIEKKLCEREQWYSQAQHIIEADYLEEIMPLHPSWPTMLAGE